jgi:hypothetical protein
LVAEPTGNGDHEPVVIEGGAWAIDLSNVDEQLGPM